MTLLMPFILGVFLMILFTSYYVHDRVIIEKTCYVASLRGGLCTQESLKEYAAKEAFEKEIEGRLLCKWDYDTTFTLKNDFVITDFEGRMQMREGLLLKLIGEKVFYFCTECKSAECNETQYIRSLGEG